VSASPPSARLRITRRTGAQVVVAALAALFPLAFGGDAYTMSIATECLVYALVTVTLNLLVGFGGQISLGHAGLLAVGAYAAAIEANHAPGLPVPVEILGAGVATALVGFALGLPTGRLRGHYLAIATLGFGVAVPQIALKATGLTGGYTGLTMPAAHIGGLAFGDPSSLYWFVLVVVGLALLVVLGILTTSTGRSFTAVRDSEPGAEAMGINVQRTKVLLFTLSAFFTGVAGDLFAHLQNLVSPSSFPFSLSLFFLAAVVVGGLASVWGSVAAAILLVLVQEKTSSGSGLAPTIVGGTVVLVLLFLPGGLATIPAQLSLLVERMRRRTTGSPRTPAGPRPGGRSVA
jgi:branched-chain amino acid transport system permease protein